MNTLTFSCAQDIENHVCTMRNYFEAGNTLPVSFRIEQIKKLRTYQKTMKKKLLQRSTKILAKQNLKAIPPK